MGLADEQGMAYSSFMAVKTPCRFNARHPFNRLGLLIQTQVATCAVLTEHIAFSNRGSHGVLNKAYFRVSDGRSSIFRSTGFPLFSTLDIVAERPWLTRLLRLKGLRP